MYDTHKQFARRLGVYTICLFFSLAIWEFGFDSSHVGIYTLFVVPTARQQNIFLFFRCDFILLCWSLQAWMFLSNMTTAC